MSGLYGIFRFDQGPIDLRQLDGMREAMSYYGAGNHLRHFESSIALGHLLAAIQPEELLDTRSAPCARGLCLSVARLDNRSDLLETFAISSAEARLTSDRHLVQRAFDKWGDGAAHFLMGDWALAAWDRRARTLILARDACGNSNLYYYRGDGWIAFASSLKALLSLPGTVKEPDRDRLSQLLTCWEPDAERTAYKGFYRLVSAQALKVGPDGECRFWQHWSPRGREPIRFRRDEEYEEAFLDLYAKAVRNCLRSEKPIAASLSGGRDSGSVVSLAARELAQQGRALTAYTSVPCFPPDGAARTEMGDEWEVAHLTTLMAGSNVEHVPLDAAQYGVLEGIRYFLNVHDGPSHAAINHYWLRALSESAAQQGKGIVLTGQLGNFSVSWPGNGLALFALAHGDPRVALRLFLGAEPNPWQTIKRQILKPLLGPPWLYFRRLPGFYERSWRKYSALNPEMSVEVGLGARMRAAGYDPDFIESPLSDSHALCFTPEVLSASGIWSELGAKTGISFLDPTANQALIEFVLGIPDDQFRRRGRDCSLFRRSFQGQLPAPVLEQHRKGLQAADAGHRILRERSTVLEYLDAMSRSPEARAFLNLRVLNRCLEDLTERVDPVSTSDSGSILLRGMGVGLFLLEMSRS